MFEAIGGSGKSMLTWEWVTNHATDVRKDWAGRFWYSFYEKGALMADFCESKEALAASRVGLQAYLEQEDWANGLNVLINLSLYLAACRSKTDCVIL